MRILFMGSGGIGLPTLEFLQRKHELCGIVAQPDKPAGRSQKLLSPETKRFGEKQGIPVLQPRRIREPEALEALRALEPELIVVMAYGQILPRAVLELAPKGCLNLHASILPKYRGAAPIQAAILDGEPETGITVMWMDEGLDTGDVLLIRRTPISETETGGSLHDRLAGLAAEALADALPQIAAGTAPKVPQENDLATYAGKLSRESGIIDWSGDAALIERQIRAMNPWPSASTTLSGKRLKVFAARQIHDAQGAPGELLRTEGEGLLVAAGSGGALLLSDLQLEGKRRMPASEMLRGHPLEPGLRLGEAL